MRRKLLEIATGLKAFAMTLFSAVPGGSDPPPYDRIRKQAADGRPWYQVFLTNRSRHLGQVMAILPFPLGTRTLWRHRGQVK